MAADRTNLAVSAPARVFRHGTTLAYRHLFRDCVFRTSLTPS
jgi:hypothetical protein